EFAAGFGSRGEFEPGLTGKPFIRMRVQLHQLAGAQLCDVADFAAPRFAVNNLIDPPAGAMDAAVFVTFARVAPVEHEHAAVRAVTEFHAAEPGVRRDEKVRPVPAHVTAAAAFEDFLIGTATVEIQRKKTATIF